MASPPSGVPLNISADIPSNPLGSASALIITGVWSENPMGLSTFDVTLSQPGGSEFGTPISWMDATDFNSTSPTFSRILSFPTVTGGIQFDSQITLGGGGTPQPGSLLTLTVRSAQVPSGASALTMDTIDEPVTYSEPVEVAQIEVLTWEEWYILIDRDGSQPGGGS